MTPGKRIEGGECKTGRNTDRLERPGIPGGRHAALWSAACFVDSEINLEAVGMDRDGLSVD